MASMTLQRKTSSLGAISTITPPQSQHNTPSLAPTITTNTPPPSTSLYHTCRLVLDKLALVPGMSYWLDMEEDNLSPSLSPINASSPPLMPLSTTSPALVAVSTNTADSAATTTSTACSTNNFNSDPLSKLCYLCRRGTPLFTLFNALNTNQPLKMDPNPKLNQVNNCKANVYHFLVACRKQLLFPEEEVFTVSDLYVDDTNGFVKVVNTVLKILQLLEDKGIISSECASRDSCPMVPPKDVRDQVVLELLSTERKYVNDLETLQTYMRDLQQQRILSQDTVHYLFGNLNALVDFQRRFLFQMEKTAENQPQDQHFGLLFSLNEEAFSVYEPYCSNFYSAQDLVVQEAPKLQKLNIMNPTHQLTSLLIKPIQRICKYPLLLNELIKSTNKECATSLSEMADGLDTMRRVADKVNETQRKHENLQMVVELKRRVDNWKGISIDKCGQLLLQDKLVVSAYDNEREMHIFFFENRLLLCKESKDNNKNRLTKANTITIKKRRRGTLEPKGKIETSMITCLQNASANGEWALAIEWKEQDVEKFTLKFRNEEQYKLWESALNKRKGSQVTPSVSSSSSNQPAGVSQILQSSTLPLPQLLSSNDHWSFIDPDDEEDEVDSIEDDVDDSGSGSRSRSNSFSAHILNTFSTRPRASRNNSSDISTLKSLTTHAITGRSNTPGLNLQPLPRSNHGTPIYHHDTSHQSSSADYFFYPSSPPPSNPSSPTTSSRVSPNNSSSGRSFRDHPHSSSHQLHHHYLQQQQQYYSTKGLPMSHEPMTPALDYFATQSTDPFDAAILTARPGPSLSERHPHRLHQSHHHHQLQQHRKQIPPPTRSRARSSPTIQSSESRGLQDSSRMPKLMNKSTTWDQYVHQPATTPLPRLSDKKSSASLHSHMDRVLTAASSGPVSPGQLKVKMMYNDGAYSLVIPQHVTYIELMERVEQKLHVVGDLPPGCNFRLKYRDEDGDFITINSNDDIQMAFEGYWHSNIHLFVCL